MVNSYASRVPDIQHMYNTYVNTASIILCYVGGINVLPSESVYIIITDLSLTLRIIYVYYTTITMINATLNTCIFKQSRYVNSNTVMYSRTGIV